VTFRVAIGAFRGPGRLGRAAAHMKPETRKLLSLRVRGAATLGSHRLGESARLLISLLAWQAILTLANSSPRAKALD